MDESYGSYTPDYELEDNILYSCEKYKEDWIRVIKPWKEPVQDNFDGLISTYTTPLTPSMNKLLLISINNYHSKRDHIF